MIASRSTSSYYSFEESFQLADGWLLIAICAAGLQLHRRRASALLWLMIGCGAASYLLAMDAYYDVAHSIYASNSGGTVELLIDLLIAAACGGALWWGWRYRSSLGQDPD